MDRLVLRTRGSNREEALKRARAGAAKYYGVAEDDPRLELTVNHAVPVAEDHTIAGHHAFYLFEVESSWELWVDTTETGMLRS